MSGCPAYDTLFRTEQRDIHPRFTQEVLDSPTSVKPVQSVADTGAELRR